MAVFWKEASVGEEEGKEPELDGGCVLQQDDACPDEEEAGWRVV